MSEEKSPLVSRLDMMAKEQKRTTQEVLLDILNDRSICIVLSPSANNGLILESRRRRTTPVRLLSRLAEVIMRDDLFEAVLDGD